MPELPEVETIRRDLESELIGLKFTDVKLFWPGSLKGDTLVTFKKKVLGTEILTVTRRAKNIAVELSNGSYILMHMKMTGHLLIESAHEKISSSGTWQAAQGALADPINQYIRAIFWLNNGKIMAFSDLRKFGYIKLLDKAKLAETYDAFGPEPFSNEFNPTYLQNIFAKKKQAIKKVLMDQTLIAGVGNIYADEILWKTKIHPTTPAKNLSAPQINKLHQATLEILEQAIKLRGTSSSDYRDTKGKKGNYEAKLQAYRRTGKPCSRCHTPIVRINLGGRGTHFCPQCQRLEL
jgi:formamidopyrimidine-DNA glycosylase